MDTPARYVDTNYERVEVGGSAKAHIGHDYHTGPRYYIQNYSHHLPTPAGDLIRSGGFPIEDKCNYIVRYGGYKAERESVASILKRVSGYDASTEHRRRSSVRVPGTCRWIFKDHTFLNWQGSGELITLWCTGPVGCGKSILASSLVDYLAETKASEGIVVPHCYIESTSSIIQNAQDILWALAKQLLTALTVLSDTLPLDLEKKFREVTAEMVSVVSMQRIQSLFEILLSKLPGTIFIVDGIDCLIESQILDFLGFVRNTSGLFQTQGSKLAIISRKSIGKGIDVSTLLPQSCSIALNYTNLKSDISTFVDVQMMTFQSRRVITSNKALLQKVRHALKACGQEMFLWIYLQLLNIWDPKLSKCDNDITSLLDSMPSDLQGTYKWCLRRISCNGSLHTDVATRAFRWVSQAKRPLSPRQLREAVSLRNDGILLTESAIVNFCVTEYCANLLVIDSTGHVRFTHPSVQQFLEEKSNLGPEVSTYYLSPALDNRFCGQTAISYLASARKKRQLTSQGKTKIPADFNEQLIKSVTGVTKAMQGIAFKRRPPVIPTKSFTFSVPLKLAELAVLQMHDYFMAFWLDHTTAMAPDIGGYADFEALCLAREEELWPGMPSTLTKAGYFQHLMRTAIYLNHAPLLRCICENLQASDTQLYRSLLRDDILDNGIRAQHLAAAMGHLPCVDYLIGLAAVDISARDADGKTALYWAADNGHMPTVWLLSTRSPSSMKKCQILPVVDRQSFNSFLSANALTQLSLPAILARRPNPECCYEFISNNRRNDLSLANDRRVWSQTFFAACLGGHSHLAGKLISECNVDVDFFQPFAFPEIQNIIRGDTTKFAIMHGLPDLLYELLKLGASFDSSLLEEMRPRNQWDMYMLLCCRGTFLVDRPEERPIQLFARGGLVKMKPADLSCIVLYGLTDRVYESLRKIVHGGALAQPTSESPKFLPMGFLILMKALLGSNRIESSLRRWRDLARIALWRMKNLPHAALEHPLSRAAMSMMASVRSLHLTTPDDIAVDLILSGLDECLGDHDFRIEDFSHRKSHRIVMAWWAYYFERHSGPDELCSDAMCSCEKCRQQGLDQLWPRISRSDRDSTLFWLNIKSVMSGLYYVDRSAIQDLRRLIICKYEDAWQRSRSPPFRASNNFSWLIFTICNIVCECCWSHCKLKRWPSIPISQKFRALCDANSDGIFELNYPIGYIEISEDERVVKPFIVSALYRWNWRLRRRRNLPYSEADRHYCPTICARAEVRESEDLYD